MRKNIIMAFAAICSCLPGSMQAFNDLWSSQVVADEEARQLYISPTGKDSNDGDAPDKAWKTWSKVLNNIQPGDVVNIMPGTYSSLNNWKPLIDLKESHSGTEDGYIYFRAYDPNNRPKFKAGGKGVWNCVDINASYIVFDGIEMEGNNQDLDSLSADNISKDYKNNSWNDLAVYNTNGINVGGGGNKSSLPHHVIIRNCIVHDFPGGGVGGGLTDYLAFENNTIYNNAWFTMYACSGISIISSYNSDESTEYKNIVIGNTVYNNHTKIKWYTSSNPRFSDGNGIIMDVNLTPDNNASDEIKADGAYRGKTLVANNVSYFNGGSGIHAFKAQNIDIFNNTTYMNEQRYNGDYGEIFSQGGKNNRIINNIMYSKSGGKCNNFSNGGGTYSYNLYYNGSWTGTVGSNKMSNPKFVHAPVNPADEADFHVAQDSPAVSFGQLYSFIPDTDKEGVDRTTGTVVGAYQTTVATGISSVAVSKDDDADNRCYDLMGRPVTSQYHGIVIMKGKKIIMK